MFAVLEHIVAMSRMARSIRGDKHRLDLIIFDQFLERRIGLLAAASLRQLSAAIRKKITDCNYFHIRVILKTEISPEFAHAISNNADPKFSIREWLPRLRSIRIHRCTFESLNYFVRPLATLSKSNDSRTDTARTQKCKARDGAGGAIHAPEHPLLQSIVKRETL